MIWTPKRNPLGCRGPVMLVLLELGLQQSATLGNQLGLLSALSRC
jgi:hypothetical protein